MRRLNNISAYFIMVALTTIVSCGQNQDRKQSRSSIKNVITDIPLQDSIVKNGNVTTNISTDIDKLEQLLDFKTYKPSKVKFKYAFIDNSGQNQRLSVPGPSDHSLQALLYFDSLTYEEFLDDDRKAEYPSPNRNKDEFKFDWLDEDILEELDNSKEDDHGRTSFFLGSTNSKVWYLDKKILISKWTN